MIDFAAIRNQCFDDLLRLRHAATVQAGQAESEAAEPGIEATAQADVLLRLDVLRRTESLCRTQDVRCHLLNVGIEP